LSSLFCFVVSARSAESQCNAALFSLYIDGDARWGCRRGFVVRAPRVQKATCQHFSTSVSIVTRPYQKNTVGFVLLFCWLSCYRRNGQTALMLCVRHPKNLLYYEQNDTYSYSKDTTVQYSTVQSSLKPFIVIGLGTSSLTQQAYLSSMNESLLHERTTP
jgi:hypothetical protein